MDRKRSAKLAHDANRLSAQPEVQTLQNDHAHQHTVLRDYHMEHTAGRWVSPGDLRQPPVAHVGPRRTVGCSGGELVETGTPARSSTWGSS